MTTTPEHAQAAAGATNTGRIADASGAAPCRFCGDSDALTATGAGHAWTFTIALPIASLNDRSVNEGHARHAYRKGRDTWGWAIKAAMLEYRIPLAAGPRRVTITRHYRSRGKPMDYDNLVGGAKPIIDNLVGHGLLLGDDPNRVITHYRQAKAKKASAILARFPWLTTDWTEILIEDLTRTP